MSSPQQRQWRSRSLQRALLEYKSLKYACPEGIYVSITPENFCIWSGVFFVRKGPYASAVLRFRINLPMRYPCVPPYVAFTTDVFHPLVTPSTVSSHATGSVEHNTFPATDHVQLPSGGFSFRHGFPTWFRQIDQSGVPPHDEESLESFQDIAMVSECDSDEHPTIVLRQTREKEPVVPHQIAGSGTPMSVNDTSVPSIIHVLYYMKQAFEEESLLDSVMLDEALNEGAWHAWKAHRAHTSVLGGKGYKIGNQTVSIHGRNGVKPLGEWNWEGVWEKRVKAIITASISDPALFANGENDDPIHFLDLSKDTIKLLNDHFCSGELE